MSLVINFDKTILKTSCFDPGLDYSEKSFKFKHIIELRKIDESKVLLVLILIQVIRVKFCKINKRNKNTFD